jgi:hypothetical protein
VTEIDTSSWGEFQLSSIFKVERPDARSLQQYSPGSVPFVASGDFDNGVVGFCEPKVGEKLDQGNCVTVSPVDGSVSYQAAQFLGRGGAGSSIFKLYNESMNEFSGLFIAAVVGALFSKMFGYSDMGNSQKIENALLKLPINDFGEPDWIFMEESMRTKLADRETVLKSLLALVPITGL